MAEIFLEVEPLTGRRYVTAGENRTRRDWALFIRAMLDERYPEAIKVRLVLDNLNPHTTASLYETFPAPEARRLAERIEFHYTPKHGSWLNVAEIELSALASQCLDRRIASLVILTEEIDAWQAHRNNRPAPIDWQFTTSEARIKLKRLYPNLYMLRGTRPTSVVIASSIPSARIKQATMGVNSQTSRRPPPSQ